MALIESTHVPLGSKMPAFKLKDAEGKKTHDGSSLYGEKGLLVAFTCNHCPYAIAVWPRVIQLAAHAKELGINTVGINPNIHPNFPEDAPDKMVEKIKEWKITFPYLVDETQQIAKKFDAQCTPDLYLFDQAQKLVYHGRLDDNWQNEALVKKQELKDAIEKLAEDKKINSEQRPSMGCSIKWVRS